MKLTEKLEIGKFSIQPAKFSRFGFDLVIRANANQTSSFHIKDFSEAAQIRDLLNGLLAGKPEGDA